jgi:hypothetical protein
VVRVEDAEHSSDWALHFRAWSIAVRARLANTGRTVWIWSVLRSERKAGNDQRDCRDDCFVCFHVCVILPLQSVARLGRFRGVKLRVFGEFAKKVRDNC